MTLTQKLASAGHLTDGQAQQIEKNAQAFDRALEDLSFLKEAVEKLGIDPAPLAAAAEKAPSLWARIAREVEMRAVPTLVTGGLLAGGGLAAAGGRALVEKLMAGRHRNQAFEEMLEVNPQLKSEDPTKVQRIFDSLYRFNPAYARDPMVSGTFVDSSLSDAKMHVNTINSLVDAHAKLQGRGPGSFSSGVEFFSKAVPSKPIDPEETQRRREEHEWAGEKVDQQKRDLALAQREDAVRRDEERGDANAAAMEALQNLRERG